MPNIIAERPVPSSMAERPAKPKTPAVQLGEEIEQTHKKDGTREVFKELGQLHVPTSNRESLAKDPRYQEFIKGPKYDILSQTRAIFGNTKHLPTKMYQLDGVVKALTNARDLEFARNVAGTNVTLSGNDPDTHQPVEVAIPDSAHDISKEVYALFPPDVIAEEGMTTGRTLALMGRLLEQNDGKLGIASVVLGLGSMLNKLPIEQTMAIISANPLVGEIQKHQQLFDSVSNHVEAGLYNMPLGMPEDTLARLSLFLGAAIFGPKLIGWAAKKFGKNIQLTPEKSLILALSLGLGAAGLSEGVQYAATHQLDDTTGTARTIATAVGSLDELAGGAAMSAQYTNNKFQDRAVQNAKGKDLEKTDNRIGAKFKEVHVM